MDRPGIFNREHEPPEPSDGDVAHGLVRTALGLVPGGADLFNLMFAPPFTRRTREWAEDVAATLRSLESDRGIRLEDLQQNEAFLDCVFAASSQAVRTSQKEKRAALRNAVVNAALPAAPEVAEQQMFLALLDRLTDWHIRILGVFRDPRSWRDGERALRPAGSMGDLIEQAFPALRNRRDFYDQIWSDLRTMGLHNSSSLQTMMTPDGTMSKRLTPLGERFLAFIESPE